MSAIVLSAITTAPNLPIEANRNVPASLFTFFCSSFSAFDKALDSEAELKDCATLYLLAELPL